MLPAQNALQFFYSLTIMQAECKSLRLCSLGNRSIRQFVSRSFSNTLGGGRKCFKNKQKGSKIAIELQQKPEFYPQSILEQE